MAKRMDKVLGTCGADALFNENEPVNDTVTIEVSAAGKRGEAVTGTAGKAQAKVSAALDNANALYILADDIDEAGKTVAYRAGHFNKNTVEKVTGYTFTAADVEVARAKGIFLTDAVEA